MREDYEWQRGREAEEDDGIGWRAAHPVVYVTKVRHLGLLAANRAFRADPFPQRRVLFTKSGVPPSQLLGLSLRKDVHGICLFLLSHCLAEHNLSLVQPEGVSRGAHAAGVTGGPAPRTEADARVRLSDWCQQGAGCSS